MKKPVTFLWLLGALLLVTYSHLRAGIIPPPTLRTLNPVGTAAKCQAGVAAAAFSFASGVTAPQALCESDGIQAYLDFTAGTQQIAYDRFDLPRTWIGSLKVVVTGYSTGANTPTMAVKWSCVNNTAVASPAFGSTQSITFAPAAASGRTSVSTTLTPGAGCLAGYLLEWNITITALTTDIRLLSVTWTE